MIVPYWALFIESCFAKGESDYGAVRLTATRRSCEQLMLASTAHNSAGERVGRTAPPAPDALPCGDCRIADACGFDDSAVSSGSRLNEHKAQSPFEKQDAINESLI